MINVFNIKWIVGQNRTYSFHIFMHYYMIPAPTRGISNIKFIFFGFIIQLSSLKDMRASLSCSYSDDVFSTFF